MQFTSAEIRLIALHARLARPLHETVRALAEALPEASPRRVLELAKLASDPEGAADDSAAADDDDDTDADDTLDASEVPDESEAAMAARHADELARCASDDERAACATRHAKERTAFVRRRTRADRAPRNPDRALSDSEFRARMARDPMVLGLNRAIAELRGRRAAEQATTRVDAAIAAGKLVPAQRDWAVAYCTADAGGFARFVDGQPALALAAEGLPGGPGTTAAGPGAHPASLSEAELRICGQTRTDPQKFMARRTQVHAAMAAQPAAGTIIRLELD